ncbi:hypothetical protein BZA77DRAFT_346758 [Pyronema omphalodes]|nr:hypothetical protein BZA77DRAFT_346758 [Pyronema omphalodes]
MFATASARQQLRLGLRSISTTRVLNSKLPALGDITHTPENSAGFKERQRAFRAKLEEQKKAQFAALHGKSYDDVPKAGIVKSILYGSEKGQREDAELEQSYSKVLARGKYVHAIEIHNVKPDKQQEYSDLVGSMYPDIANDPNNSCHLVGSWKTEIGDPDTFIHIWEYKGYAGYHDTLNQLQNSAKYRDYSKKLPQLLYARRTDLMQEFSFWPTTSPRSLGGIFELRSYTLHPGNLLEWETHWRAGLAARRNVMEGVGAWFTQVGALNMVHYLWQFQDLRDRQLAREHSWSEQGWSSTVHKTVPLIQKMESRILVPLPWSPVS